MAKIARGRCEEVKYNEQEPCSFCSRGVILGVAFMAAVASTGWSHKDFLVNAGTDLLARSGVMINPFKTETTDYFWFIMVILTLAVAAGMYALAKLLGLLASNFQRKTHED